MAKAIRRGKVLQAAGGLAAAGWCSLANIGKGNGRQGTRRMDARAFENCKFPSRHVTEGLLRTPHPARAISRVPQTMGGSEDGSARDADGPAVSHTIPRTLENVKYDWDQGVVYAFVHPISAAGEGVGLQCSRAREGAIVKDAGMTRLQVRGPMRAFAGVCMGHAGPEAAVRGPIRVAIDVQEGTFDLRPIPIKAAPCATAPTGSAQLARARSRTPAAERTL
jgi:hypothetical protein